MSSTLVEQTRNGPKMGSMGSEAVERRKEYDTSHWDAHDRGSWEDVIDCDQKVLPLVDLRLLAIFDRT